MATVKRPYFDKGIAELESLCENSPNNFGLIAEIFFELTHRKSKRAKVLQSCIEKRLAAKNIKIIIPSQKPLPKTEQLELMAFNDVVVQAQDVVICDNVQVVKKDMDKPSDITAEKENSKINPDDIIWV